MTTASSFVRLFFAFLTLGCCASPVHAAEYTTFIGDTNTYQVARVAADPAGNTYIAGTRLLDASSDIFVVKLDPAGNIQLFRTISGKGTDTASDMTIDAAGNIYIGGSTSSTSFPVHNALQSTPGPGFLVKLDADGSQIVWSTYFREQVAALAVDAGGNVYVTGTTNDPQFPVTPGLQFGPVTPRLGFYAAFLTKISAAGDHILYSALISGSAKSCGFGSGCSLSDRHTAGVSVSVDAAGNAYLAGNTDTSNLATTPGAFLATGAGAFAAKVKGDGTGLVYLTYIGATIFPQSPATNPANTAVAIASDADGNAYLTGTTFDPRFPATSGAYQTTYAGPSSPGPGSPPEAFVLKLNPAGTALVWASYLGGSAAETVSSIAVDTARQVWINGTTASPEFPNAQGWSQGSDFIAGFDVTGSKLIYSARYPNDSVSRSIAVDATGALHVTGRSGIVSVILPANPPLPRIFGVGNAAGGPLDGHIAGGELISIYGPHIGPATPVITVPDANGDLPTAVPGYQVLFGGQPLPLLYLSDSQINAVVPFGFLSFFYSKVSAPIHVNTPNGATPDFPLTIVLASPAIFRNPDYSAVAINQDGTRNAPNNPALAGSYVSIWMTGSGHGYGLGNPGHIETDANNYRCCGIVFQSSPQPLTGSVSYAGTAPGAVLSVTQINFLVPAFPLYPNPGPVSIQAVAPDGTLSDPVTIYVGH